MSKKLIYSFWFLVALVLCACKKNAAKDEDFLREKFNGKYELVTAYASQSVDMNLDGIASNDLSREILNLSAAHVELRVSKNVRIFTQFWQEQYLSESSNINVPHVEYAKQGMGFSFSFNEDLKSINLDKTKVTAEQAARFAVPETVKNLANDVIEVVFDKRVYTSKGWKDITIAARYKKYTNIT